MLGCSVAYVFSGLLLYYHEAQKTIGFWSLNGLAYFWGPGMAFLALDPKAVVHLLEALRGLRAACLTYRSSSPNKHLQINMY